jgi:hypothetical protein
MPQALSHWISHLYGLRVVDWNNQSFVKCVNSIYFTGSSMMKHVELTRIRPQISTSIVLQQDDHCRSIQPWKSNSEILLRKIIWTFSIAPQIQIRFYNNKTSNPCTGLQIAWNQIKKLVIQSANVFLSTLYLSKNYEQNTFILPRDCPEWPGILSLDECTKGINPLSVVNTNGQTSVSITGIHQA